MLSWNSNNINHTFVVPKGWFNQYKVHRVSVREPFTHISFYFPGRCCYQLCTWGNQTASQLLWKKVCKRCVPRSVLLRNQQRRHLRLCTVSSLLRVNEIRFNEQKHLKYITEKRGSLPLGTQNYRRQPGIIPFSMRIFQKKKDARAFQGLQGSFSASTLPCSV